MVRALARGTHSEGPEVATVSIRYRSADEDSGRWVGFPFRDGDIVISTRSKSGTTWLQMIAALLVFQTPDLPRPLPELSPWLDWLITPQDEVYARLAAQRHRRFIKTHTPLDGIPLDTRATYIVVARHPLDAAVSLYHQGNNLDRERIRALTGQPASQEPSSPRPSLHEWLLSWIDERRRVPTGAARLAARRAVAPVRCVGAARRAQRRARPLRRSGRLTSKERCDGSRRCSGSPCRRTCWPDLVAAATFDSMRAGAQTDRSRPVIGVLKDIAAFFRRGTSGAGAEVLNADELARYHARTSQLAPPDLLAWLHR